MGHCHGRSRHCACSLWCVAVVGDAQRGMGEAPQGGVVEEGAEGLVHLPAVSHEKRAGGDEEITPRVPLSHHAPFCPVPPLQRPHPPLSSRSPQHHGLAQHCSTTTLQHYNTAAPQHCSTTTLQHYNTAAPTHAAQAALPLPLTSASWTPRTGPPWRASGRSWPPGEWPCGPASPAERGQQSRQQKRRRRRTWGEGTGD